MTKLYLIILILFILFIIYQIYFYSNIYKKNEDIIKRVESFQSTLVNIDKKKDYLLDDNSIEILLEDYNKLKNNI
jgi:ABC-type bacteriocin/lantibiotic exporter with double-glycine peptidase domain